MFLSHPGGVPMGPWGPFGQFLGRKRLFPDKFPQKSKFSSFLRPVSTQYDLKTSWTLKKQKLLTKISKKGLQKLQKLPFLIEKASFSTKNTHKIETISPRDLKSGLK